MDEGNKNKKQLTDELWTRKIKLSYKKTRIHVDLIFKYNFPNSK